MLETQLNLCAPVGVDKRSVDTWMQPTQFRMHVSTGAPPDMFATQGQNWGFPTYQWSEMEKDGYSFWRRRLTHMSQCATFCSNFRAISRSTAFFHSKGLQRADSGDEHPQEGHTCKFHLKSRSMFLFNHQQWCAAANYCRPHLCEAMNIAWRR